MHHIFIKKTTIYLLTFFFTLISTINSQNPPTPTPPPPQKTCTIHPNINNSSTDDDAPSIIAAFKECGTNGRIVFLNETYHIESVMNTTGLHNCQIDIYGTLIWGTNISYWLNHSVAYGYQNQSSVWWIGGDGIRMDGHGVGTLDGNGQTWYDFVAGVSNYPNRPEALTIWNTQDSIFQGLRFIQSQMWTVTIFKTNNILLQNIYVNSTSNNTSIPARNTDGCDTIYSSNIHFKNWTVINGDDSIALKANSTNILIEDSTFINGLGVALGSIGQYLDVFEILENITVRDCSYWDTLHAGYVKTWTDERVGYPPNGGGGGLGYAKNTTFKDLTLHNTTLPFSITQCTTFSGVSGDCNSSLFQISDIVIKNISGTIKEDPITSFQCSASAPCTDFTIENLDLWIGSVDGEEASGFNCSSLVGATGFNCTGETCGTASATGVC